MLVWNIDLVNNRKMREDGKEIHDAITVASLRATKIKHPEAFQDLLDMIEEANKDG